MKYFRCAARASEAGPVRVGHPAARTHEASIAEIHARFVASVSSCTRQEIFDNWLAWREAIYLLVPVTCEWIDGSFISSRVNPKDIDVAIWVDAADFLSLSEARQLAIRRLFGEGGFDLFKVDATLIPRCEAGDPLYPEYQENDSWVREAFATARDRSQRLIDLAQLSKGKVEVSL